ncbi:MAG: hypothetical protein DWG76_05775 [Chloroflexi bacterium]|nr:hypothetical protein [Chloroflexota bacterium]
MALKKKLVTHRRKPRIWLLAIWLVLVGCNLGVERPVPTIFIDPDEIATIVAATLEAQLAQAAPTATESLPDILPHSVYFLSPADGIRQVWRLAADGVSLTQISRENELVSAFDVSLDGRVALVSSNRLVLLSADGAERSVLVDGSDSNPDDADYNYRQSLSAPRFAPDGRRLAYALDGIHLFDLTSSADQHILANRLDESNFGTRPEELFFPESWSPDGRNLLVAIGYLEGGSLTLVDPETGALTPFQATGILCCQAQWAPDSASILLASPTLGLIDPGFWRYDAQSGAETVLLAGVEEDATFNFAGWPMQTTAGELFYFYTSTAGIPEGELPLFMVRSPLESPDQREQVRADSFLVREALWAENGSLALLVPATQGGAGPLTLARSDGSPLQILSVDALQIRWGP